MMRMETPNDIAPVQQRWLAFLSDPDAWYRRAAFTAIYPEIVSERERQLIAEALYWVQPSDADVRTMDAAFARTLRLVRGVAVNDRLSGV